MKELITKIVNTKAQIQKLKYKLEEKIAPLKSIERIVIRYRASGLEWNDIAKLVGYSARQSRRFYDEVMKKDKLII